MEKLKGPVWFETVYRRPSEKKLAALTRLSAESGLMVKTLYRVLREQPVTAKTATALLAVKGGDRLDSAALVFPAVPKTAGRSRKAS